MCFRLLNVSYFPFSVLFHPNFFPQLMKTRNLGCNLRSALWQLANPWLFWESETVQGLLGKWADGSLSPYTPKRILGRPVRIYHRNVSVVCGEWFYSLWRHWHDSDLKLAIRECLKSNHRKSTTDSLPRGRLLLVKCYQRLQAVSPALLKSVIRRIFESWIWITLSMFS